ncbi:phospholipase D family protein [Pararhodobacter oceanensis]|uniref:Phospholipase D n=1 Tax=Pararhodobacter oceanensis TaxID=2172121 RepID=A0A2T8HUQ7_9RHOB|nr:phospholipase D-like domain-containing protein [Pararhodobacter oceanensis]PVH29145.1 phospholipase [Pararhodobacter oceanensis]
MSGDHLEILVTARQAYPRLEALFLSAQSHIRLGFRLFDPRTRLLSEDARKIGDTWSDLLLHTINRGVPVDLTVSDFDPVVANRMHRQSWQFIAIATALNEVADEGAAKLTARCVLHPASGGIAPRLLFALKTRKNLRQIADEANDTVDPQIRFHQMPGLYRMLDCKDGRVCLRRAAIPQLNPVTLHHKLAVIDEAVTYIGGLDLNNRRIDDPEHEQAAQQTWHDLQLISHDPGLAKDAAEYLRRLPDVIDRKGQMPAPKSMFRTTISRRRARNYLRLAPQPVSQSLLRDHLAWIAEAQHFIYLETQYFRDRRIVAALLRAARANPRLKLVLLLPAAPDDVAFHERPGLDGRFGEYLQARAIRRLKHHFGDRVCIVSPVQPRRPDQRDIDNNRATLANAPIVYVHSKVAIFDTRAAIVSSANLNGRSMKWDAEAGVTMEDPADVAALTKTVFDLWLGDDASYDPEGAFDRWAQLARANAARPPEARKGFVVPYDVEPAEELGMPVPGAPADMM